MSATVTPAFIPLEIVPNPGLVPSPGTYYGFKVGIPVSLDNGATYRLYEFDTGGGGFEAAYNPSWWSSYTPVNNGETFQVTYKSGIIDTSQMVSVPVTFETLAGSPSIPTANYDVAQIISVGDTNAASSFPQNWTIDVNAGGPPPLYGNFWGDFGASLENTDSTYLPGGDGFLSILPQLGTLANGFIVALGPEPGTTQTAEGYLQVGLTPADIDSFPIQIKMNPSSGAKYPNSDPNAPQMPIYAGILSSGTLVLTDNPQISNADTYATVTGLVWDTGTPTVEIYPGETLSAAGIQPFLADPNSTTGGSLASGNNFSLTSTMEPQGFAQVLNFVIGMIEGNDAVNEGDPQNTLGDGSVNTGLQPFFQWDVMFDVADGIIGLRPHQAPPCFVAGTAVATKHGPVPVEQIRAGDRVLTLFSATEGQVIWIGNRRVDCARHPDPKQVWPVRISADAFAEGRPSRDLWLSPDHAVYLRDVLIPIKYLVNGSSIVQVQTNEVDYYHIELDRHDVLFAEALPTESYLDTGDRNNFANANGPTRLFPDFAPRVREAQSCVPLVITGPEVQAVREMLQQRADEISVRTRSSPGVCCHA